MRREVPMQRLVAQPHQVALAIGHEFQDRGRRPAIGIGRQPDARGEARAVAQFDPGVLDDPRRLPPPHRHRRQMPRDAGSSSFITKPSTSNCSTRAPVCIAQRQPDCLKKMRVGGRDGSRKS